MWLNCDWTLECRPNCHIHEIPFYWLSIQLHSCTIYPQCYRRIVCFSWQHFAMPAESRVVKMAPIHDTNWTAWTWSCSHCWLDGSSAVYFGCGPFWSQWLLSIYTRGGFSSSFPAPTPPPTLSLPFRPPPPYSVPKLVPTSEKLFQKSWNPVSLCHKVSYK